ncbi:DNA-binding response regulator [Lacticaseibacillus rhamnosus]
MPRFGLAFSTKPSGQRSGPYRRGWRANSATATLATRREHAALTPREVEGVRHVAEGLRNKEIAFALGITEQTAKVHVKNILAKLNVNDRTAIIPIALRRGIIHIR